MIDQTELINQIREEAIVFDEISTAPLSDFLNRVGDARVVLLGEATHGTSEFYQMRAQLTQALIAQRGFNIVAIEADWPDAALVNRYVGHVSGGVPEHKAFNRFPQWMWRNQEFHDFVEWLRKYNSNIPSKSNYVGLYGLDLYSLYQSIDNVIRYLDLNHPHLAELARQSYNCLMVWQGSPSDYGLAVLQGENKDCREEALSVLRKLLEVQVAKGLFSEDEEVLDAIQNALLVVNAEKYYRIMWGSSTSSWNLRDGHMFETLNLLLSVKGEGAKAIVWEHNSHVGNAKATEMQARGEINVGQLCKEHYGDAAYLVGFGTHEGTVAAAASWGGPMKIKKVLNSHKESYERLFHETGVGKFFLPLLSPYQKKVRQGLMMPMLERAIGVIYRPDTERFSHYFHAILPEQFDEYIWFDQTRAITPLSLTAPQGMPDTYPFGL